MGTIRYEVGDGVATITINRPERANAIAPQHRDRIIELMESASGDLNVRAVLLRRFGNRVKL